jgi:hypothetical protein
MSSAVPNFLMLLRSAVALALLIAPFVAVERAQAACAPKSPISDATVTCTGATSNQNAPLGYGRATETRNPIGSAAIGLLHCNREGCGEIFPDQLSGKRHFNLSHCPKEDHLAKMLPVARVRGAALPRMRAGLGRPP